MGHVCGDFAALGPEKVLVQTTLGSAFIKISGIFMFARGFTCGLNWHRKTEKNVLGKV